MSDNSDLMDFANYDIGFVSIRDDTLMNADLIKGANSIIYQALSILKADSKDDLTKYEQDIVDLNANESMKFYLALFDIGYKHKDICSALHISSVLPVSWRRLNKAYSICYDLIQQSIGAELEATVIDRAKKNEKDSLLLMFATKKFVPEYRENAPAPAATTVNLRVTIDGSDFDVSANYKNQEDD